MKNVNIRIFINEAESIFLKSYAYVINIKFESRGRGKRGTKSKILASNIYLFLKY